MSAAVIRGTSGALNLQATLSASSAMTHPIGAYPHHPVTCSSELALHDDGRLACEHGEAPADDQRTRHCVNHSVAILLIECAVEVLA